MSHTVTGAIKDLERRAVALSSSTCQVTQSVSMNIPDFGFVEIRKHADTTLSYWKDNAGTYFEQLMRLAKVADSRSDNSRNVSEGK